MGFRVLGFRVLGFGMGIEFRVYRVLGLGSRVSDLGLGSGLGCHYYKYGYTFETYTCTSTSVLRGLYSRWLAHGSHRILEILDLI